MDNNSSPVALAPAKPYEGDSQHQSVHGAIRRLVAAGLLSGSEWVGVAATATGRGSVTVNKMHCIVTRLSFRVRSRGWNDETLGTVAKAVEAFRAAGWTVIPASTTAATAFDVHGPGIDEWVTAERARQKAEASRKLAAENERWESAVEYRNVLTFAGIPAFVDLPTGTAKLTLADVRKLVAHFGGSL